MSRPSDGKCPAQLPVFMERRHNASTYLGQLGVTSCSNRRLHIRVWLMTTSAFGVRHFCFPPRQSPALFATIEETRCARGERSKLPGSGRLRGECVLKDLASEAKPDRPSGRRRHFLRARLSGLGGKVGETIRFMPPSRPAPRTVVRQNGPAPSPWIHATSPRSFMPRP